MEGFTGIISPGEVWGFSLAPSEDIDLGLLQKPELPAVPLLWFLFVCAVFTTVALLLGVSP